MEKMLIIFIVALNIFAILMNVKMLNKYEMPKRLGIIVVAEIVMFCIVNILYGISSKSVSQEVASYSKTMILFTFLPLNMMIIFAPIARKISNLEEKQDKSKIILKCIIYAIIIIVLECIYMNNIQVGIEKMAN